MTATLAQPSAGAHTPDVQTRRWLDRAEAARLLGVSRHTFDRRVRAGLVPKYVIEAGPTARRLTPRYRIEDVEALITAQGSKEQGSNGQ